MKELFAVFIGGGFGSAMRYCVQLILHERITPYNFPWATLTVNLVGCVLIGLFYALSAKLNWSSGLRLLLTAGLCGGFTTFSTFCNDITEMLQRGEYLLPAIYIMISIVSGIAGVIIGTQLIKVF